MKKIIIILTTLLLMNSCKECKPEKIVIVGKKTNGKDYVLGLSNGDGIEVRYGAYCMLEIGDTITFKCGVYDLSSEK